MLRGLTRLLMAQACTASKPNLCKWSAAEISGSSFTTGWRYRIAVMDELLIAMRRLAGGHTT